MMNGPKEFIACRLPSQAISAHVRRALAACQTVAYEWRPR